MSLPPITPDTIGRLPLTRNLFPQVKVTPELLAASLAKAKEILAGEQVVLPLNPAWSAPVVAADGRFWLDTTSDALLHPSAHGAAFRAYDHEYVCQTATTLRGLIRVTAHIPVLLPPGLPIKLEVQP